MIDHLVILGATGDLTGRYLMPALVQLVARRKIPPSFTVTGVGRHDWTDEQFQRHVAAWLAVHASHVDPGACQWLCQQLRYRRSDVADPAGLTDALEPTSGPVAVYLALPAAVVGPVVDGLGAAGLPAGSCIVLEKPFGTDLASARALNERLHRCFDEGSVFRVDHFLGIQTVQGLIGLRFANRVFDPIWNAHHVERVDIRFDETLGLEGRAGYYDTAGALRDMVQNHLLQLLCLVAMEPPASVDADGLRDRKVDVLRATRPPASVEDVARWTRRGRYTAGRAGGRTLPNYVDEPGVDSGRATETFASVTFWVDNWRWAGVPFSLHTGKALGSDLQCIDLHFRSVPSVVIGDSVPRPNRLRVQLEPDRIALRTIVAGPGRPLVLDEVELAAGLTPAELPPYGRVLLDVLTGGRNLSIRADEAEESWRVVEPVLAAWASGAAPLVEYPAGSASPTPTD